MLARGLSKISNRLAALAPEASPELGDAVGFAAVDLDRHTAIVEVLVMRQTLNAKETPMNELAKRNDATYAQRYEVTDPFAAFAAEGGPGLSASRSSAKRAIGRSVTTATPFLPRHASSSSLIL